MIKLQNVFVDVNSSPPPIDVVSRELKISPLKIKSCSLYRRSVDARKKPKIFYCNTYLVELNDIHLEKAILKRNINASNYVYKPYSFKKCTTLPKYRPIVVGSGPAGLFAALTLARGGLKPIIIEKGEAIDDRVRSVEGFWRGDKLNPRSNVQFGEGGAGTFSDGKLNTGIKDPRCRTVLEEFCRFGANGDVLINAKPHIGTDVLRDVVKNIRNEIVKLGGEYRFNTEFLKPIIKNSSVCGALFKHNDEAYEIDCDYLILAPGNAARETFFKLYDCGIKIIQKPFAIGVRIEHLQADVNRARYGDHYISSLPPAEYKLAVHLENGRGVYSFCMCPGGLVVNSASEPNSYVTNGMSYQKRDLSNANSALLVGVTEADILSVCDSNPFGGIYLQQSIEGKAYSLTKGRGLPSQTVGSFLNFKENKPSAVLPTALPNTLPCNLNDLFPAFITDSLKTALPIFEKQIPGFASDSALLTAPETRSSCPVRILRDDKYLSNVAGLYPCGEGAGYAGGITSSAVDGMRVAEAVIESLDF